MLLTKKEDIQIFSFKDSLNKLQNESDIFYFFMDTLFYGCRNPTWGLICNVCELKTAIFGLA